MRPKSRTVGRGRRKPAPTRQAWAKRINAALAKSVAAFVETGRLLIQAKKKLPHGEFLKMLEEDLRINPDKAQRLMSIARHPVLSNAAHVRHLPPNFTTLFDLSRFPPAFLQAKIKTGDLNPDLQRRVVTVWDIQQNRRRAIEESKTVYATRPVTVEIRDAPITRRVFSYRGPPRPALPPPARLETSIDRVDLIAAWKDASSDDRNHLLRSTIVERDESGWRLRPEIIELLRHADN